MIRFSDYTLSTQTLGGFLFAAILSAFIKRSSHPRNLFSQLLAVTAFAHNHFLNGSVALILSVSFIMISIYLYIFFVYKTPSANHYECHSK